MPKTGYTVSKQIARTLLSLMLLVVVGLIYASWQWRRTVVTVDNQSGLTLQGVKVLLDNGDYYDAGRVSVGQSYLVRISPPRAAGLWVVFVGQPGNQAISSPGTYIDSLVNRPRLTIGKNGVMKWDSTGWLFTPPADNFIL